MGKLLPSQKGRQCHSDGASMTEEVKEHRVRAARTWLRGYVSYADGKPFPAYHDADTPIGISKDREGRLALAHLLMNGEATTELLELLANAIAPDDPENQSFGSPIFPENKPSTILSEEPLPRRLDFRHRRRGNLENVWEKSRVLQFIHEQKLKGVGTEAAVGQAVEKFGKSREMIYRIWDEKKDFFAPLYVPQKDK